MIKGPNASRAAHAIFQLDCWSRSTRAARTAMVLGASVVGCSSSSSGGNAAANDASVVDAPMGSEAAAAQDSGVAMDSSSNDAPSGDASGMGDGASPDAGAANIVIADQYNNRVIEIDPTGQIVWSFGDGKQVPGPTSIVGPNDEERLPNGQTLIAGTGIPGPMAGCTLDAGCPDNRVILVDQDGGIVWSFGDDGGLNTPVCSVYLPSGNVLITDQGNARIIEVTQAKAIAWTYQPLTADGGPALNNPNSAERLTNGNTLVTDENNSRVLEVATDGGTVWQYPPASSDAGLLSGAAFASRLASGNTLITSANNALILEVDTTGKVVWSYNTAARTLGTASDAGMVDGGNAMPQPTRAVRLANGDTLISDQFNNQIIQVNQAGQIVFQYGQLNVAGSAAGQLSGPYDAKRVGDFTGLTPPQ